MTAIAQVPVEQCGCDGRDVDKGLLPVDDALQQALTLAHPTLRTEDVSVFQAAGRVLAKTVFAQECSPRFDNAAVDGYAVATTLLTGDGPWTLPVQGRIAAGDKTAPSTRAAAVQIFTGALVPSGLDAVVMQEEITVLDGAVSFAIKPAHGQNIRRAGEEYRLGAAILRKGTIMGAAEIACAAAAGAGVVTVYRQAKVGLVVSGNEIRPAGTQLGDSEIYDINTPMMQAVLCDPTVIVSDVKQVSDRRDRLADVLRTLAAATDMIVVTGGASVGKEDHLKAAIADAGGTIAFSGVAIKPGKPVTFGTIGDTVLVGLPGNPLSAFVTWKVLGQPLLDRIVGKSAAAMPGHHVKAGHLISHKTGRCEYRPARISGRDRLGIDTIETDQATHSARMTSLLWADGLIRIPSFTERVKPGDLVEFFRF